MLPGFLVDGPGERLYSTGDLRVCYTLFSESSLGRVNEAGNDPRPEVQREAVCHDKATHVAGLASGRHHQSDNLVVHRSTKAFDYCLHACVHVIIVDWEAEDYRIGSVKGVPEAVESLAPVHSVGEYTVVLETLVAGRDPLLRQEAVAVFTKGGAPTLFGEGCAHNQDIDLVAQKVVIFPLRWLIPIITRRNR